MPTCHTKPTLARGQTFPTPLARSSLSRSTSPRSLSHDRQPILAQLPILLPPRTPLHERLLSVCWALTPIGFFAGLPRPRMPSAPGGHATSTGCGSSSRQSSSREVWHARRSGSSAQSARCSGVSKWKSSSSGTRLRRRRKKEPFLPYVTPRITLWFPVYERFDSFL